MVNTCADLTRLQFQISIDMQHVYLLVVLGIICLAPVADAVVSSSKPGARRHSSSVFSNSANVNPNYGRKTTSLSSTSTTTEESTSSSSQQQSLLNVNTMMFVFYTTVGATLPYLPMYYKHIELTGTDIHIYYFITTMLYIPILITLKFIPV